MKFLKHSQFHYFLQSYAKMFLSVLHLLGRYRTEHSEFMDLRGEPPDIEDGYKPNESSSKQCHLSADCGSCQWISFDSETRTQMRLQKVKDALVDAGLVDMCTSFSFF